MRIVERRVGSTYVLNMALVFVASLALSLAMRVYCYNNNFEWHWYYNAVSVGIPYLIFNFKITK